MLNQLLSNRQMDVGSQFSVLPKPFMVIPVLLEFLPSAISPWVRISTSLQEGDSQRRTQEQRPDCHICIHFYHYFPTTLALLVTLRKCTKCLQTHNHQTIICNLSTRKFCIIRLSFPPPVSHSFQKQRLSYILPNSVNALALVWLSWRDADLFAYNASSWVWPLGLYTTS